VGMRSAKMNDRFKFRVFISDKKNSKNSLTGMFKVHSLHTGTNKAIISSLYGNVSIKLENNILMQCTGLKDKNGKLIYEGDIVAVILKDGRMEDIGCVEYGYFNCSCCDGVYGWGFGDADIRNYDRYTIVGNIHENPEMIDENNRD
jgi:uncharacterized phage protein (TIGR01671 family)